jgi:probable rRNA maturation factor
MIDVTIHRHFPVSAPDDERIARIIEGVIEAEAQHRDWEIAVVFVDDAEMRRMHRDFMGIDEPTDIMTFPSESEPDGPHGGDLIISIETAAAQASEFGNTVSRELEFLIVHGMLHLLGWDDAGADDRAAMLARQDEILAEIA